MSKLLSQGAALEFSAKYYTAKSATDGVATSRWVGAFDSVDHELLLRRLEFRFGFTGDVPEWIKSYLTNRTFTVIHRAHKSSEVELECSVPQGVSFRPLLFILCTA